MPASASAAAAASNRAWTTSASISAGRRDWHNDYASFLLDLGERLRNAPDEATRRRLLTRVSEALR